MFRLQHSPLSGDSVSTFMGTAISQTQFHMYDFHCTLLARPVGSSVLGEPFPDHTCIPCQTDIIATKTKVTFMEFAKQRNTFFTQLPRKAIVPFHKKWEKESKKEAAAQAFRGKSNIFCIKLMQSIEFCMRAAKPYDLWL